MGCALFGGPIRGLRDHNAGVRRHSARALAFGEAGKGQQRRPVPACRAWRRLRIQGRSFSRSAAAWSALPANGSKAMVGARAHLLAAANVRHQLIAVHQDRVRAYFQASVARQRGADDFSVSVAAFSYLWVRSSRRRRRGAASPPRGSLTFHPADRAPRSPS